MYSHPNKRPRCLTRGAPLPWHSPWPSPTGPFHQLFLCPSFSLSRSLLFFPFFFSPCSCSSISPSNSFSFFFQPASCADCLDVTIHSCASFVSNFSILMILALFSFFYSIISSVFCIVSQPAHSRACLPACGTAVPHADGLFLTGERRAPSLPKGLRLVTLPRGELRASFRLLVLSCLPRSFLRASETWPDRYSRDRRLNQNRSLALFKNTLHKT